MHVAKPDTRPWTRCHVGLPGRYRSRMELTRNYVLQVSGWKNGQRHRATLYCLMLDQKLRPVWSRKFYLSVSAGEKTAKTAAIKILKSMVDTRKDHLKRVDATPQMETELHETLAAIAS